MRPCGEETSLSCSQEVKLATEGRREGQWCLGNKWRGVLEPCCRELELSKQVEQMNRLGLAHVEFQGALG